MANQRCIAVRKNIKDFIGAPLACCKIASIYRTLERYIERLSLCSPIKCVKSTRRLLKRNYRLRLQSALPALPSRVIETCTIEMPLLTGEEAQRAGRFNPLFWKVDWFRAKT